MTCLQAQRESSAVVGKGRAPLSAEHRAWSWKERELAGPVLTELTGWRGQLGRTGVGAVMETRLVEFGLDSTLTPRTQQVWKWGSPCSDLEAPHHQCWAHQRWNMMQVWFPGGARSGRVLMFNTGAIFYLVRKTLLRLTLQNSVCLRTLVSLAGSSPRPILVALPWHSFLTLAPAERHGPLGFWVSLCELASGPRNRFFFLGETAIPLQNCSFHRTPREDD